METIILVSVLSTIGVVAVLLSVALAFIKLRSKVDVNEIRDIYQRIDEVQRENVQEINVLYNRLEHDNKNLNLIIETSRDNLYRFIDSRCDKLESKIKSVNLTEDVK